MFGRSLFIVGLGLAAFLAAPLPARAATPTAAVYSFDTTGIPQWWGPGLNLGDALAELLSDNLIKAGSVSVVDRDQGHLDTLLKEQNMDKPGDVTPATEAQLGRMLGAKYLFVGKVVQFDKADGPGAKLKPVTSLLNKIGAGEAAGTKTTLHVSMKVIEADSGRDVAAVDDTQISNDTSLSVSNAAVDYKSADFQSSAMGKLLEAAADDLARKVDVAAFAQPSVSGRILGSDAGEFILNVGSDGGVQSDMMFKTFDVKQFTDIGTGKKITSEIPTGVVEVISVSKDSAVAKKISGTVRVNQAVRSE